MEAKVEDEVGMLVMMGVGKAVSMEEVRTIKISSDVGWLVTLLVDVGVGVEIVITLGKSTPVRAGRCGAIMGAIWTRVEI